MDLAITSLGVVSPFGVGRASWESALADPQGAMAAAFRSPSEVLDAEKLPGARTADLLTPYVSMYKAVTKGRHMTHLTERQVQKLNI